MKKIVLLLLCVCLSLSVYSQASGGQIIRKKGSSYNKTSTSNISSNKNKANKIINRLIDNFVYVEGGTFLMGPTPEQDQPPQYETPVHSVYLSSFYIGKYEVTQEEWKIIMGNNPSQYNGNKLPVENVSWYDCQEFINKLNNATGKVFRLPTEAEWEYAARGGVKTRNYKYSGSNYLNESAWFKDNSTEGGYWGHTNNVGLKSCNELGLFDMSGNVWEWCKDWDGYYTKKEQVNPTGPLSGSKKIIRGGSYLSIKELCRISKRSSFDPTGRDSFIGFRLVLENN